LGRTAAAIAAPYVITSTALGTANRPAASERIVMGTIGTGGRGRYDMAGFLAEGDVQMVAVCDVQADRCRAAQQLVNERYGNQACAAYRDLRELLGRQDLDAVLIATGDRWHALASVLAAKAGKDVYSEKPMSLTIAEGRAVADAMRGALRVYQCGTQRRSDPRFAFAASVARSGKLGPLQTIQVYTPGFVRNIGAFEARPAEPEPPREILDWDLWLGPVPWRPYNKSYVGHVFSWSYVPDLGGGGITDWGTHQADLANFANHADTTSPVEYEQVSPKQVVARYANGVRLIFEEGIAEGLVTLRFQGADGWIRVDDNLGLDADPKSLLGPYQAGQRGSEEKPANHIVNFLECVKQRKPPVCNAEVAHRATTACHIANICLCLGRPVKWDPEQEAFLGDDVANRMRSRALRQPWCL